MRVALIGDQHQLDAGGASHYALELGSQLVRLGVETTLIAHGHKGEPEEEEIAGLKVRRIKGPGLGSAHRAVSPVVFRRCHRYIHDGRFDVVHGVDIYWTMAQMAVQYAHRCSIPSVLTCHTVEDSPFLVRLQRPMGLLLKRADRLIAVSRASEHFSHLLGCPEQKIAVVPNGVDLSCFNENVDSSSMRKEFGVGDEPLVVMASRLVKRRSPGLLISAFARVLEVIPEAKLIIAGSGREKNRLCRQIERLNIANSVFMAGQLARARIAQLMAAADVYVSSSRVESFGLALLEASAVGVPVVCSNAGGAPEVFHHGFNALLYRPGDADAMAHAISRLLTDRELAKNIRLRAVETASKYTWETAAKRTLRVYEELLQQDRQSKQTTFTVDTQ
ncbi:MAG: glycosyltransferase family 4 protein [Dehalococcoidia bacterium]